MKKYAIVLLALVSSVRGYSTVYTTNGSSTNWALATAWTPNGVPDINQWPNDEVIINHNITHTGLLVAWSSAGKRDIITINSGATLTCTGNTRINNGYIRVNAGATFNTAALTVQYRGEVVIASTATVAVTNNLNFQSNQNAVTNSGTLTVGGSVTFTGASNLTSTGTFSVGGSMPITNGADVVLSGTNTVTGDISTTGGGSDFDLTGGTLDIGGDFDVNSDGNVTIDGATTVGGDWNVTGSGGASVDGSIIVTGNIDVLNNGYIDGTGVVGWGTSNINPANSGAYIGCVGSNHDDNGLTAWTPPPFNPLDLSTCTSGTLPIELVSFGGQHVDGINELSWTTLWEQNNDFFTIERSVDGITWEAIGFVAGAGNSSQMIQYSTSDFNPLPEGSYYRLKQTDFDAQYSYSKVIYIKTPASGPQFVISPNPSNGAIAVNFSSELKGGYYYLTDVKGVTLLSGTANENLKLDLSNLPKGIYIFRYSDANRLSVEKVVLR